jgi:ATP-dependent Lon protease
MLEIDPEAFSNYDIHIHFPPPACRRTVPRPASQSARDRLGAEREADPPRRRDDGEVSLRGKVLLVGGLREKALAAYRAGIRAMCSERRT